MPHHDAVSKYDIALGVLNLGGWAVTLAMAGAGGLYLYRCVQYLAAPGVPIVLDYDAVTGTSRVRASSFELDISKRSVVFKNVLLKDSKGRTVASATRLDARQSPSGYAVETFGLQAWLVRDKDGKFNVESVVPKPVTGAKSPFVELRAKSATLHYLDTSQFPTIKRTPEFRDLSVIQESGNTLGSAILSIDALKNSQLKVQVSSDGGFWTRIDRVSGEASTLLPVIKSYLDLKHFGQWSDYSVQSLNVDGWIEASAKANQLFDVRGDLTLRSPRIALAQNSLSGSLFAHWSGALGRSLLDASLTESGRKVAFQGFGSFGSKLAFSGKYQLSSTHGQLWPIASKLVPKGLVFRGGTTSGQLNFGDGKIAASGVAKIVSATYQKETLRNVNANYLVQNGVATVRVTKSEWRNGPITGALQADTARGNLKGVIHLSERPLATLLAPLGVSNVSGSGSAKAIIGGTFKAPLIDVLAKGKTRLELPNHTVLEAGNFEGRARISGQNAVVQRFLVTGTNGVIAATGTLNLQSKALTGQVMAGAVPLSVFSKDTSGTAFGTAQFSGTLGRPVYTGRFEAYGAKFKDIGVAQIVGQIHGDKELLTVDRLSLLSGTGSADGSGLVMLKDQSIKGKFNGQNLSLSEYFGEGFLGSVQIEQGTVSGTLSRPAASAVLSSQKITARGVAVDSFTALIKFKDDLVTAENATALIHGGKLVADARFTLSSAKGNVQGKVDNIGLADVFPSTDELRLTGSADGSFTVDIEKDKWKGSGALVVSKVGVNGSPLGSGELSFQGDDGVVHVQGEVGSVDRFLSLKDLEFDVHGQSFTSQLAAYNLRLNDIILATKPYWSTSYSQRPEWFEQIDGAFTGSTMVTGSADGWTLGQTDLSLENLIVAGRKAGRVVGKVAKEGDRWVVPNISWTSENSSFEGSGWLDDNGMLDAKATVTDFDLSWIRALAPDTPLVTGKATASFVAKGSKDDPSGRASLLVDKAVVTFQEGQKATDPIQLILDNIEFGNKRVSAGGHITYSGFTGAISAMVPYSSLNGNPEARREEMVAGLEFEDRPLSDFKDYVTAVDFDKSQGNVRLKAKIEGTVDDLRVSADAGLDAPNIAFKGLESGLQDLRLGFVQRGRKANLTVDAKSSRGGRVTGDLQANLAHVFGSDFDVDALLDDSTLSGKLNAELFEWLQKLPGAKEPTQVRTNGLLTLAGSLRNPEIGGRVAFDKVIFNIPQEVVAGTASASAIDPKFKNVVVEVSSGSKIETGVGPLVVVGSGSLNGSLNDPDISVPLVLQNGTFRLPSGRITLEPGGQILFSYTSLGGGEPVARVNLDLEGHTTVVARRNTGEYEPFQITLGIQGNALDDKNLRLTAVADPPDLSQDEILSLIGQKDLIQGLAQGVLGGSGEASKLRDAVYSFAVPSLSQNLTQGIASGLKLDYLSVDYNPFDQVILSAGKTIGKGLLLQVSRQLQGTESSAPRYEVKLSYRLPVADRFFSRVRLGIGFDQNVPFKLSLNWSKRF